MTSRRPDPPARRGTPRGFTLLEACLAIGALCFGVLALAKLQTELATSLEASRERAQAVRLAQAALERQRLHTALTALTALTAPPPAPPAPEPGQPATAPGRPMTVTLDVLEHPAQRHSAVRATVAWRDRQGRPQLLRLDTLVATGTP